MGKRTDLKKILVIGSGPIIIGQACEFDYSGTQAIKALQEEGYEVVLVNSNPATIMTDPELADITYIEPIELDTVSAILRKERPCAILPTLGGQTGLNTALALAQSGILQELNIELLGADRTVIEKAESRELFRKVVESVGCKTPASRIARNMDDVRQAAQELPFPIIIRPAFTLGGTGGGVAYNQEDLESIAASGLAASMKHEIMLEESVLGWKELEVEVMRDQKGTCICICLIENFDPMGVHTGDSITVAPTQSLTQAEQDTLIELSFAIMQAVGMREGGANLQFAMHPKTGDIVAIEMNPRVSRSSALASKATGFPIARVAALLAVGHTLDALYHDQTGEPLSQYQTILEHVIVKIPRFTFEKFPGAQDVLSTAMKSVGEVMSVGRNFKEALQKGLRGLEVGASGFGTSFKEALPDKETVLPLLRTPNSQRIFALRHAMLLGMSDEEIYTLTAIDHWFLKELRELVDMETQLTNFALQNAMTADNPELISLLWAAKRMGYGDRQLADMWKRPESDVRRLRESLGILPGYGHVTPCATGNTQTAPYYYSTYALAPDTLAPTADAKTVIILGGGPNRIGQGIEFDYCCCHAAFALKNAGYKAVMVNSNPETVSTDYDTSDSLYFEPLTCEDVLNIVARENPLGVIVQFGGQTPLNLAVPLMRAGVPILGTSPDAIDRAEDRERFQALITKLGLLQPDNAIVMTQHEAHEAAKRIGFPVVVRPSYVLGGRAMAIVYDEEQLHLYFAENKIAKQPEHPILIDKFLDHATEVDVDALSDGVSTYVAGIMEHIEEAGIHSGDSACVLPPYNLDAPLLEEIKRQTDMLAQELRVVGLMNIQFAVKGKELYVLEVNPRASRTSPFVSKATGVPLARMATQIITGATVHSLNPEALHKKGHISVKEAVFPFNRFPGVDILLGPEMRSTGEVMGIATTMEGAFYKAQLAAGVTLPERGKVFISVNDRDKPDLPPVANLLAELGFELLATSGTSAFLATHGITTTPVFKVYEGRPNVVDLIKSNEIALVLNTASGSLTVQDSRSIRQAALLYAIPHSTTLSGAQAIARAIAAGIRKDTMGVTSLQEYYAMST